MIDANQSKSLCNKRSRNLLKIPPPPSPMNLSLTLTFTEFQKLGEDYIPGLFGSPGWTVGEIILNILRPA